MLSWEIFTLTLLADFTARLLLFPLTALLTTIFTVIITGLDFKHFHESSNIKQNHKSSIRFYEAENDNLCRNYIRL